ncbi:MAG: GDP-L-fucose synthase [Methylococcales bacterium]|nr:GDP-L-fucose synthase [Methylococcales bacterium]MCK5924680.1 GDP-L-fucose synthase [Methylococcales bacterium]
MFNPDSKIYLAGHSGLLGSALQRVLEAKGYKKLITRSHKALDLTDKRQTEAFFNAERPEYVFLCAGKVGGIIGNKTYPADFLQQNLAIQTNVFEMAHQYAVKNLMFYGSSCTYPKLCKQPMHEDHWLTGAIEETSMGYAAAKIAGIIACRSYNHQYDNKRFICVIPNSMIGENDNFDLENAHVFSALIRRFHEAKKAGNTEITLWGTGNPRREFIFSDDVADASIFLMKNAEKLENQPYNLGTGTDYSIKALAKKIAKVVGFQGHIKWDTDKPDGTPRKLLDSARLLALGWQPQVNFDEGLVATYDWFKKHYD